MKILFLIASLRGGGAERVAATLCNHWVQCGHEVVLVTFDDPQYDFYTSDPKIVRHSLACFKTNTNKCQKIISNLKRIAKLRKIVRHSKPAVVVSFMDVANILAVVSCFGLHIPVIISERTYPPYFNHNNLFDKVRKFIYKFTHTFVAQTSNVGNWAAEFLPRDKITVIPNPVDFKNAQRQNTERENIILAMGRLGPEKGYDMLIQAFAQLHTEYPDWRLKIVGEGQERPNLEAQVSALGLQHKILLPGQTKDTQAEFCKAKIFALTSRVEGFPNVLIEAMAHGVAAISFDCNSGPADIIQHGVNGVLVPPNDVVGLTSAMQRLVVDSEVRQDLALAATGLREKYSLESIANIWLSLFEKALD